jgi:chromate reductase
MSDRPILVISGTNRPNSNTRKLADVVLEHYVAMNIPAEMYSLTELPQEIFNPSSYAAKPPAFVAVQERIVKSAGLHVVTPEYNGSFPGVLKYFIDMLKFPESFERKPVAFIGLAAGIFGALRPVEHLQGIFGYRNAYIYPDRVFIAGVSQKLGADGQLNDDSVNTRIASQVDGFARFVQKVG